MADEYEPTWESLDSHPVPNWYHDAKLGIFIHWGAYSVPAWAPVGDHYAEWYPFYMYEEGSQWAEHHREEYGDDVEYVDFLKEWKAENWEPAEWAELFADVGAGYVVLTGEHHDGIPLWETHYAEHNTVEVGPERDIVADLSEAVHEEGLRFAASYHANLNYYQPGFNGRFGHPDYDGDGDFFDEDDRKEMGPGSEYVDFMNAKHRELIRKYDSDLLWFDVPMDESDHLEAKEFVADYYNAAEAAGKGVVVNDRMSTDATRTHGDFYTPEYETFKEIVEKKWEACRGLGHSFGYNAAEETDDHLSVRELVRTFVDIVSKNGNLLINVGPQADGTIPDLQKRPLLGPGEWLDADGEAIFGTTYWRVAEDDASDVEVRYTWKDDTLYATCFAWPGEELALDVASHAAADNVASVELVRDGRELDFNADGDVTVELPADPPVKAPAYSLAIDGVPGPDRN